MPLPDHKLEVLQTKRPTGPPLCQGSLVLFREVIVTACIPVRHRLAGGFAGRLDGRLSSSLGDWGLSSWLCSRLGGGLGGCHALGQGRVAL